jgi:hypothetical protein
MYTPINGWTKQSIIDHIQKNFKGRSVSEAGMCAYRGVEDRRCAVGMFIPDALYDPRMDIRSVTKITSADFVIPEFQLQSVMPLSIQGMCALQAVHDASPETACLADMLRFVRLEVL